MKNEAYTVKLSTEVKEEWQDLVNQFMKDYGLGTIGEAYPVLIDVIRSNSHGASANLTGYIKNIRLSLDSILKNVMAMDGEYKEMVETTEDKIKSAKASLVSKLEKEIEEHQKTAAKLKETKTELEKVQEQLKILQKENKELKENRSTQEEILGLLKNLKNNKES